MMKLHSCPNFFFLFFFLLTVQLSAATITWTGGGANNLWSNTANWDLLTVPNTSDEVIIPDNSGTVLFNYFDREAKTVWVGEGATLRILAWATLRLNSGGFIALEVVGTVFNRGTIIIDNATNWGILNEGVVDNRGLITIEDGGFWGLENKGTVYNRTNGVLEIKESNNTGVVSHEGVFLNEGILRFLDNGTGEGMTVGDGFENALSGSILFEGTNPGQINVLDGSAENFGLISFDTGATNNYPLYLSYGNNHFYNRSTGEIRIKGFAAAGISITEFSIFENDGLIVIKGDDPNSKQGILASGSVFTNSSGGRIRIATLDYGITVGANTIFDNYGTIKMSTVNRGILNYGLVENLEEGTISFLDMQSEDVHNEGTFINYYCANIFGDQQILNFVYFVNYGWITYATAGGNHALYGLSSYYLNKGIIVDPYDRFSNKLDNEMARATFLSSPQAHVPYPNALDIGGTTDLSISNFYLDENLNNSAGTYDLTTNTYTPNNNAIGATTLYAEATAGLLGCTQVFSLRVIGGVQPLVNPNPNAFGAVAPENTSQPKSMTLFPNPSTGAFSLQFSDFIAGDFEVQLIDIQGRLVWQTQSSDATQLNVDLTGELTPGMYQVQMLQGGKILDGKRLVIQ